MTPDDAIFLALKPRFAREILSGTKTVELRRKRPRDLREGSLVVLYASSPVKAVVGTATVERIVTAPPSALWPTVAAHGGISRAEFDEYFDGAIEGTGIFVHTAASSSAPYPLDEIRADWPGFHPPQAFRYLRSMGEWAVALLTKVATPAWLATASEPSIFGGD